LQKIGERTMAIRVVVKRVSKSGKSNIEFIEKTERPVWNFL